MIRDTSALSSRRFDLLVVGGGICGLACAYDAAQRGLSVALIEQGDFGSASSFNHAKTVHGGLRSLQTGNVAKAREAVVERRTFARIAPHLLEPLPFLMGTSRGPSKHPAVMRAGFIVDRLVGWDRNAGVETRLCLPAGRIISKTECLAMFPGVRQDDLTGGALWYDYQMVDADRLTFAFAEAAAAHGAVVANHVAATSLVSHNHRVSGVGAADRLDGSAIQIEAKVTLVTAGAWTVPLVQGAGITIDVPLIKAMNLVTNRRSGPVALGAPTAEGRLLLMMPWNGRALIGTAHGERPCTAGDNTVTSPELGAFLAEVNSAFPTLQLGAEDVTLVHRGVVPAVARRDGSYTLRADPVLRDHTKDGVDGALSLIGVKYTTARAAAQAAVDVVVRKLRAAARPCRTAVEPLPSAAGVRFEHAIGEVRRHAAVNGDEVVAPHLVRAHGTWWPRVLDLGLADPTLLRRVIDASPVLRAELVYAVRHEMACTLEDVLVRRTALGSAGYPGDEAVLVGADIVGHELGWTTERRRAEAEAVRTFYAPVAANTAR